ncbi:MAG: hypothetical protein WD988_01400 [Candidatus Curtissbacteria bacterium]
MLKNNLKFLRNKIPKSRRVKYLPVLLSVSMLLLLGGLVVYLLPQLENRPHVQKNNPEAKAHIISAMSKCYQLRGQNNCYKNAAQDAVRLFSVDDITRTIGESESTLEIYSECHTFMHFVGQEEYKRVKNLGQALSEGSFVCFEGYQHGVVEGYFVDQNISIEAGSAALEKEIQNVCGKQDDYDKPELFSQCLHGIGHAAMFLTQNEVPMSLELCDMLQSDTKEEYCYSGVFMENSNSSTNKDHPSKYVDRNNPLYPCTILGERYLKMCYEMQSFKFFEYSGQDWPKTIALCDRIPREYQSGCFRTIGSTQVGFTQDFSGMKAVCDLIKNSASRALCLKSIVTTLSTRFGGDVQRMSRFCNIVDPDFKNTCYSQIGLSLKQWIRDPEQINSLCQQILEEEYKKVCENPQNI